MLPALVVRNLRGQIEGGIQTNEGSFVPPEQASGMSGRLRLLLAGLCSLAIASLVLGEPFLRLPLPHRVSMGVMALAGLALIALGTTNRRFVERYVNEATPESLAAIRILTCAILLGSVLWEDLASTALLPDDVRWSMGAMRIFYALPIGFQRFAESAANLQSFKWVTALVLFLGVVGWGTRIVVPLGAVCTLVFEGILRQYSYFWHQGIVPLYLLIVLSWTPCGNGWSLDRVWRGLRG